MEWADVSEEVGSNQTNVRRILSHLARISVNAPAIQIAVGYLLADPRRVRFVSQFGEGTGLGMAISAHRRIEIPLAPWQGFINGVPVPDPLLWIEAAGTLPNGVVAVRISTDDVELMQRLSPMITQDRERHERREITERVQNLRQELDRALDLYNEVRHVMEVDQDRQAELTKFLGIAENEMHNLGQELKFLKGRLESVDE
ncbi:MAG: hypothetical protein C7B46_15485 [Sulfobacillus benefaciens]|uniref:Uncharacterized protein n=1 Tax=Sulfobacillus benefaciens TaxID=453960 RepID=A0A2T2XCB2_9FIRM|nr:MAG: hypothetical protein C7B46_15485 [Sulfobacillus benefaciens]